MMRKTAIAMAAMLMSAVPAWGEGFEGAPNKELTYFVHKAPKSSVVFDSTVPAEKIKGTATEFTGELKLNPSRLDKATGKFAVPFKNLDTGQRGMNQHMLSPVWVGADEHPDAVFTVTGISDAKRNKKLIDAKLKGKMSIHGVDKEVTIPVTLAYVAGKDADGKKDVLNVSAKFELTLADYEIKGKPGAIGHSVAKTLKMTVKALMKTTEPPKPKATAETEDKPTQPRQRPKNDARPKRP